MRELKSQALSGKSQARGRNGWFVPQSVIAWHAPRHLGEIYNTPVIVEVWSKQRGSLAPILLHLSVEDARLLVHEIAKVVSLCDYSEVTK
jgi:hypothetical protein